MSARLGTSGGQRKVGLGQEGLYPGWAGGKGGSSNFRVFWEELISQTIIKAQKGTVHYQQSIMSVLDE